jgi:predicted HTH domain antitoxin
MGRLKVKGALRAIIRRLRRKLQRRRTRRGPKEERKWGKEKGYRGKIQKIIDIREIIRHNSDGGKMLESIAREIPLFKKREQKQTFLEVMGALSLRLISLAKAAEIMEMEKDQFLNLLDSYGFEFSFLDESDIEIERDYN